MLNFKYITIEFLLCVSTLHMNAQKNAFWGDQGDGTFRNPVIASDYSDPDPIRVGDTYYMVSSTFENSPGVCVLRSYDLVNWETVGAALTDMEKISPAFSPDRMNRYNEGVYAPTIAEHDGKFYIYVNLYTDGLIVATADSPEGPWTSDFLKDKYGVPLKVTHWTDPCPFWDDDGKAYLVSSHPGRKYWYSYIFQMSPDGKQLLDADEAHMTPHNVLYQWPDGGTVISPYHSSEGNRIFKKDGMYYFQHIEFTDKGLGAGTYVFRSPNLFGIHPDGTPGTPGNIGEYEKKKIITEINDSTGRWQNLPGQGGYVDTSDGKWYWIGQFNINYPEGRTPCLLPVEWVDGWPLIGADLDNDGIGEMVWSLPKPIKGDSVFYPQGSDDFNSSMLNPVWSWNHAPDNTKWSLSENAGKMRIYGAESIPGKGFFGIRNILHQRHMHSKKTSGTVSMDISGMSDGQTAGLAHFDGGKSYAWLGVRQENGRRMMLFESNGAVIAGDPLPDSQTRIFLRSEAADDDVAIFSFSLDGKDFQTFGKPYPLTFANFRGDRIGIFTYSDVYDDGYVDFDDFTYSFRNVKSKE